MIAKRNDEEKRQKINGNRLIPEERKTERQQRRMEGMRAQDQKNEGKNGRNN